MMKCKFCGGVTTVVDSRCGETTVRRRRVCNVCNLRFSTIEIDQEAYYGRMPIDCLERSEAMNPEKLSCNLAKNLRGGRLAKGMSLNRFSQLSGVSSMSLSRYENGEGLPTVYSACLMANTLGISLDQLFGWEDSDA